MTVSDTTAGTMPKQSLSIRGTFHVLWRALLLDGSAYRTVIEASSPARSGFKVLTVLLLTVGIATALGMLLRYLTLPPLDQIQTSVQSALTSTQLYQNWVQSGSTATILFNVLSRAFWLAAHLRLDYPTPAGILLAPLSIWIGGLLRWVTFAIFGEFFGRRLGGQAPRRAFWGSLAVASSPQLFYLLTVIPGMIVPSTLVTGWTLLTTYQAMRVTFPALTWKRSLSAQVLMFAVNELFIALALVLGILLGVALYQRLF